MNINLDDLISSEQINIESPYEYNCIQVPRVTEILSSMLHEDYLMEWANNIGLYKHIKYKDTLEKASSIGTYTHNFIERYISHNEVPDFDTIDINIRNEIMNAFHSFVEWWKVISKNDYIILKQESQLICKYFGGTLDLLIEINGKIYLVDFKTSNHPSYKYTLQLSAYRYMLKLLYNINVDGCIILMLSKFNMVYKEILYSFDIKEHLDYFNQCEETFLSLVYSYYNRIKIEKLYNDMKYLYS